jgi:hypothetical protein
MNASWLTSLDGSNSEKAQRHRETPMKVHLRFLRRAGELQEAFHNDGWQMERGADESLLARHPQVPDEEAARSRLYRLGVLTSRCLSIEFERTADGIRQSAV